MLATLLFALGIKFFFKKLKVMPGNLTDSLLQNK